MSRFVRSTVVVMMFALLGGALFAGQSSSAGQAAADSASRDGKLADLYVRNAHPSSGALERQFAAFWSPNLPKQPKLDNSYRGNTPQLREQFDKVMSMGRSMDFFSIKLRAVGNPKVTGNRMTMGINGVLAGFPANSFAIHYIREAGLWKIDWKATCAATKCAGDPNFGY